MTKINIILTTLFSLTLLSGCTRQELFVSGQSNILSSEWISKIQINQTTEEELVALLGRPTAYYHRIPDSGEKYIFYSSIATVITINHYPFIPRAQYASKHTLYKKREWFLIKEGKVCEHRSVESSEDDPDLNGYIRSDGTEYPYCDNI